MFEDRFDAGKQLAKKLKIYENQCAFGIALPRGGVAVGYPIAKALNIPLEVVVVRKLGSPYNAEFGVGAVAEDGIVYKDKRMLNMLQIPSDILDAIQLRETIELERRKQFYRQGKPLPLLTNKTVILVDDGLATGVTAHAAILSIKKHHPKKIIFAVPVCSSETASAISSLVDTILCLQVPEHLEAIGKYYHDFREVSDSEVLKFLEKANHRKSSMDAEENNFAHKIVW